MITTINQFKISLDTRIINEVNNSKTHLINGLKEFAYKNNKFL